MSGLFKVPIGPKTAILLALFAMWFVGGVGLGLMHSAQRWYFLFLGGFDVVTIGQMGAYYLARLGAQVPALALAALVIAASSFRHPLRAACFTALAFYGAAAAIRLARRPWSVAADLDQCIPVLAELAHLVLVVALIGLFARFYVWLVPWSKTGPLARYFNR